MNKTKKSDRVFVNFSMNGFQKSHSFKVEDTSSYSKKLFYENVDKDNLIVEIQVNGNSFGKALVPLREIRTNKAETGWNVFNSSKEEVGQISLNLSFVNSDKRSVKSCLIDSIQDLIFKDFISELFGKQDLLESSQNQIVYFVEIVEKRLDEPTNMFQKNSKIFENRSKIRFNHSKVGRSKRGDNGSSFYKIKSLAEDEISIQLFKFDSRSPKGLPRNVNSGENGERSEQNIGEFEKKLKSSIDAIATKFQTLSPDGKTLKNLKEKSEYFKKTIRISDIPWGKDLTFSKDEFTWTVRIVGGKLENDISSENFQPIFSADELEDLMLIANYKTLCQAESKEALSTWNGFLERKIRFGMACIRPCGIPADWMRAEANAVFTLHQVKRKLLSHI